MKTFYYENFTEEEIDNMSELQKNMLSQQKLYKELKERMPKIKSEPRDWEKPIENPLLFGLDEVPLIIIPFLMVKIYKNNVAILAKLHFQLDTVEVFTTREKINSFIDAIKQARDMVFPE